MVSLRSLSVGGRKCQSCHLLESTQMTFLENQFKGFEGYSEECIWVAMEKDTTWYLLQVNLGDCKCSFFFQSYILHNSIMCYYY